MIKFELNYLEAMIVYVYMCVCMCAKQQNLDSAIQPRTSTFHRHHNYQCNAFSLSLSLYFFSNSFYLSFSLPFLGVFLSLFLFVGIFCFTFCYLSMVFYFPESLLIQLPLSLIRQFLYLPMSILFPVSIQCLLLNAPNLGIPLSIGTSLSIGN